MASFHSHTCRKAVGTNSSFFSILVFIFNLQRGQQSQQLRIAGRLVDLGDQLFAPDIDQCWCSRFSVGPLPMEASESETLMPAKRILEGISAPPMDADGHRSRRKAEGRRQKAGGQVRRRGLSQVPRSEERR